MHITAMMVMSADGRTTRGNEYDIYSWTSDEDQAQFFGAIAHSSLIFMGSQTYQYAKPHIRLTPSTLRVVITSKPESFLGERVPGQLEFMSGTVGGVVEQLETRGYESALLVGGSRLLGSFLRAHRVNELRVTIEPVVFGNGRPLVDASASLPSPVTQARLLSCTRLNQRGTVLLHYALNVDH